MVPLAAAAMANLNFSYLGIGKSVVMREGNFHEERWFRYQNNSNKQKADDVKSGEKNLS